MENKTYILGIETSTNHCSVALFEKERLLSSRLLTEEGSHSKMLTTLIQEVCEEQQVGLSMLSAIAVSIGPGSYTGLRIGLSTAKGLCYGSETPLIAIPTLSILREAARLKYPKAWICPMLDARRMEVYCALFDETGKEIVPTKAVILDEGFLSEYTEPIVVLGNGSHKWKSICTNSAILFEDGIDYPNANFIGPLAYERFLNNSFENLVTLEPQYLKEFMGTKPKKLV